MIIFRKYISYILVFSFMAISAMDHTFSASAESNIPICTNEGVKYLLADGSLSDSKNNKIYHYGCMECIACDNSFYKKEKSTSFLTDEIFAELVDIRTFMYDCKSCFVIRPFLPDPFITERSISSSLANLLTPGDANKPPLEEDGFS